MVLLFLINPHLNKNLFLQLDRIRRKNLSVIIGFTVGIYPIIMEDHAIHNEIHNKKVYPITRYNIFCPEAQDKK